MAAVMSKTCLMQSMMTMVLKFALRMPPLVRLLVEMSFSSKDFAKNYDLNRITAPMKVDGTGAGISIMSSHTRGSNFEKLASLDIPCVIFTASEDKVAMADNLQTIIDYAPKGKVVYNFEEGGHMMMEYNPQKVAELSLPVMAECK